MDSFHASSDYASLALLTEFSFIHSKAFEGLVLGNKLTYQRRKLKCFACDLGIS